MTRERKLDGIQESEWGKMGVRWSGDVTQVRWEEKSERKKKRNRKTGQQFGWVEAMLCGCV